MRLKAALRAAFGAERALIRTVSGRGYQFTGEIRVVPTSPREAAGAVAAQPASVLPPTNVPEPVSELIGRAEELRRNPESRHHALARYADRRRRYR